MKGSERRKNKDKAEYIKRLKKTLRRKLRKERRKGNKRHRMKIFEGKKERRKIKK